MSSAKELFSRNLRKYRLQAGLSQAKLAEMLSYTGKAVSKWESGVALPPAEVLLELARVLNTDLNSLFDFREEPSFYLGVDGGGTKTRFMLVDSNGKEIRALTLGASNPTGVGIDTTINVVSEGIRTICGDIPYGKISFCAGIAGCGVTGNRTKLEKALEHFNFSKLKIVNDAENIVAAGLKAKDGVIAILGTGSVIYYTLGGERHRIGGYGHMIGDVFSGSEFGRACLEAVLYDLDGSGSKTAMTDAVTKRVGRDTSKLIFDLYEKGKTYMSSFADIVFDAAQNGDMVATDILNKNIERFAAQISSALKQFPNIPMSVPVILAGGITNFHGLFLDKLTSAVPDRKLKSVTILDCEPVIGAVLSAGVKEVKENENA